MAKIRCSSADRVWECAASITAEDPYSPRSDIANEGRAHHECCAELVKGLEPDFDKISSRYDVPVDTLQDVHKRAKGAWAELEGFFPMAAAERPLDGPVARGTADVLSVAPSANGTDAIAVLDWKSGYSQDSHRYQLMAYSDAARETFGMPSSGYITAVEVWLRLGVYEIHHFTADQLNHFRKRVQKQIQRSDDGKADATPGAWCNFCPAQLECKQHEKYLRSGVAFMLESPDPRTISPATLGYLWPKTKLLKTALRRYDDIIRAYLEAGEHVSINNDDELVLQQTKRAAIKPEPAWPILAEWLPIEELLPAVSLSKKGVIDAVRAKAKRGDKSTAERNVLDQLENAGALRTTTVSRIAIKKKKDRDQ